MVKEEWCQQPFQVCGLNMVYWRGKSLSEVLIGECEMRSNSLGVGAFFKEAKSDFDVHRGGRFTPFFSIL